MRRQGFGTADGRAAAPLRQPPARSARLPRLLVAVAAVALIAAGGGAAAYGAGGPPPDTADADYLTLGMSEYDVTYAPTPAGAEPVARVLRTTLYHQDPNVAVPPQELVVSDAGMKGVAEVEWPQGCTMTGNKGVCTVPGVSVGHVDLPDAAIRIRPLPGVAAGAKGSLSITVRNKDGKTQTVKPTVTLADGPSLAVAAPPPAALAPGATGPVPIAVANEGNRPLPSLRLGLRFSRGLTPVQRFSNCRYEDDHSNGYRSIAAACTIDQPLAPGATYGAPDALTVKAAADGYDESVGLTAESPEHAQPHPPGTPGTGPELRLVPVPGGDPGAAGRNDRSYGTAEFPVRNTADFGLSATAIPDGGAGRTVKVTVKISNRGPASIGPAAFFLPVARLDIRIPDGAKAVAWPSDCVPRDKAATYLRCQTPTEFDVEHDVTLISGASYAFPLKLRVDRADPPGGEAHLLTSGPNRVALPFDENAADDSVRLAVAGGGTGASPTASTGNGAGGAAGSTGTGGTGSAGGTNPGELPATGAGNTGLIAALAGAAVLVGGASLAAARTATRRRRAR